MSVKNTIFQNYKSIAEYFQSPLKNSEPGKLTPDEFVLAGDLLVTKCPTWQWKSCDGKNKSDLLPINKQYLETKRVPCAKRANSLQVEGKECTLEDDWLDTHADRRVDDEEVPDIGSSSPQPATAEPEDDEVMDMDSFACTSNVVAKDEAALPRNDNITNTRKYDITITYDKFYSTPRVWLFGYDENDKPLTKEQVFQDIYADYSNKTVTMEHHPYFDNPHVSIHPCNHANMMKRVLEQMCERAQEDAGVDNSGHGQKLALRPDLYLLVFLKFIAAVIPTIQYDFTTEIDV